MGVSSGEFIDDPRCANGVFSAKECDGMIRSGVPVVVELVVEFVVYRTGLFFHTIFQKMIW